MLYLIVLHQHLSSKTESLRFIVTLLQCSERNYFREWKAPDDALTTEKQGLIYLL